MLGRYDSGDREAAVAAVEKGRLEIRFLRQLPSDGGISARDGGMGRVNCFADTGGCGVCDGALAVFHASEDGEKTLTLPKKCDVYDYFPDSGIKACRHFPSPRRPVRHGISFLRQTGRPAELRHRTGGINMRLKSVGKCVRRMGFLRAPVGAAGWR